MSIILRNFAAIKAIITSMETKRKKSTRKATSAPAKPRRRKALTYIPGAKVIELVPDAFGTGR